MFLSSVHMSLEQTSFHPKTRFAGRRGNRSRHGKVQSYAEFTPDRSVPQSFALDSFPIPRNRTETLASISGSVLLRIQYHRSKGFRIPYPFVHVRLRAYHHLSAAHQKTEHPTASALPICRSAEISITNIPLFSSWSTVKCECT
jgi:hypothetical protein